MSKDKSSNEIKRSQSHQTDTAAQKLFDHFLPDAWISNKLHNDYAIDYEIQIVNGESLTGEKFYVQLKGTKSPQLDLKHGSLTFSIESKHASYYVDKERGPVFLIVADVVEKNAYWLFLQSHLVELDDISPWRRKRKFVVKLPLADSLSDIPRLVNAVKSANAYMSRLRLRRRREFLQGLDESLNVRVELDEHGEKIHISPKQATTFKIQFKGEGPEFESKVDQFINRGLPTTFGPGEIGFEGSLLLNELAKDYVTIHGGIETDGAVHVSSPQVPGVQLTLVASIEGGPGEIRYQAGLGSSPLKLTTTLVPTESKSDVSFRFQLDKWHGHRLLTLPYFEQIASLFGSDQPVVDVDMTLEVQGNRLVNGHSALGSTQFFTALWKYLRCLSMARFIARHYRIDPTYIRELNGEELSDIEQLFAVLTQGEFRANIAHSKLTLQLSQHARAIIEKNDGGKALKLDNVNMHKMVLLDTEFEVGRLSHEFTDVTLLPIADAVAAPDVESDFQCGAASEHILRILPASEIESVV